MKANRLTQYDYDTYAPIESIQHWNFVLCIYFLRYNTQYVQIAIFVHLKSIFRISWIRSPAFATNKTYICILVISRWRKKCEKAKKPYILALNDKRTLQIYRQHTASTIFVIFRTYSYVHFGYTWIYFLLVSHAKCWFFSLYCSLCTPNTQNTIHSI